MTSSLITTPTATAPAGYGSFLRRALADPLRIGAVAPTGRTAAIRMASVVPDRGAPAVLELGAGTGVLTRPIRSRLSRAGRLVAIESDRELAAHLRRTTPGLEVAVTDAADLERVLDEAGLDRVDAVVCSLPLTVMAAPARRSVLAAAARRLDPAGTFVAITYRPVWTVPALRSDLAEVFGRVGHTPTIWANVPPARLFLGREPRPC